MSTRLTFTVLLDWVEGRLDRDTASDVADLVAHADAETRTTVDWIRQFHHDARLLPLVAPPADLSERLRALFPAAVAPHAAEGWRDAELLYDTRLPQAAAGVRAGAGAVGEVAHLAFDCGDLRLVLEIAPAGSGRVDLRGMIAPFTAQTRADVWLVGPVGPVRASHIGPSGTFELLGVPEDVDELRMTEDSRRVRMALDLRLR